MRSLQSYNKFTIKTDEEKNMTETKAQSNSNKKFAKAKVIRNNKNQY